MSLQQELAEKMEQVSYHGHYFSALCPFPHGNHKESHPSCLVYPDGFKCMSCSKSGSLKWLARQLGKNIHPRPSVSRPVLPQWKSWERRFGTIEDIAYAGNEFVKKSFERRKWFVNRKIDQFIDAGLFGAIEGWITFPVFDCNNAIVDIVVRSTTQKGKDVAKYVLHPDRERTSPYLYSPSWDLVKKSDSVSVCYGIIDAWAFYALDMASISGTTGKSLSAELLKPLEKEFIIYPDRNEERDAYHLARDLGCFGDVKIIRYPDDTNDPDSVRRLYGKEKLRELISNNMFDI